MMFSKALEAFALIVLLVTVASNEITRSSSQEDHAQEKHQLVGSSPVFYGGWALWMTPCPAGTYSVGTGCCPEGTINYTPHMREDSVETLCCQDCFTQDECLSAVESLQTCADLSWHLWTNRDGSRFCCQNGDIGHTGEQAALGTGDDGLGGKCVPGRKRSPQDTVVIYNNPLTLSGTEQTTTIYYPSSYWDSGTTTAGTLETPTDTFASGASESETASPQPSSSKPKNRRKTIAGIAVGCICAFFAILGFMWRCYKRRKNKRDSIAAETGAPFPEVYGGQATANAHFVPAAGMSEGPNQRGICTWQLVYNPPVIEAAGAPVSEVQAGDHPNAHEMQAGNHPNAHEVNCGR